MTHLLRSFRLLLFLVSITFVLNLIWDNAQAPLYAGYENFWQHFLLCLWGTVGDILIVLCVYGSIALAYRDLDWLSLSRLKNWKILVSSVALGTTIAILIEQRALLTDRWNYAAGMPLIPGLDIGLLPILQMIILPLLTFYLVALFVPSVQRQSQKRHIWKK